MNYFDKILIKDLNDGEISFNILSEEESASIVRDINKTISFSGSKINWGKLKDGMYFGHEPSAQVILRLAEQIRKVTDGNLIFIGDSAYDNVYSINPEHLEKLDVTHVKFQSEVGNGTAWWVGIIPKIGDELDVEFDFDVVFHGVET